MPIETASGKVFTHITINKDAKAELRQRGIPIGSAAELWLRQLDKVREENLRIRELEEAVEKQQMSIKNLVEKYQLLFEENEDLKKKLEKNGV